MQNIDQIIVTQHSTLKESLAQLDRTGLSILLLLGDDEVLLRTITDGDIRRLLLAGHALSDTLGLLGDQPPVVLGHTDDISPLEVMKRCSVNQLPVVDEAFRPIGVHLRRDLQTPILLSVPHMGEYEKQYIEEAFSSNWIAPLGPNVDAFEQELASKQGISHAAALSSGTAAIHLALILSGVSSGDIVFCSSFTFIASANPILYQGAIPVFIDAEAETWNMSPIALQKAFVDAESCGEIPKAVVVANIYGQSANMDEIISICDRYDVPVIEDAAESLGASYKGKASGTLGRIGVYSFNGNKIITTSGGGMLVSDDEVLVEKARFLSTQARDVSPDYLHSQIGYNYRMSNILAGIGRGQLRMLDQRVRERRLVFERYASSLSEVEGLYAMPEHESGSSNRWLSCFYLNPEETVVSVKKLIKVMAAENIEARHTWRPMHQQPLFSKNKYFTYGEESVSDFLFAQGICLPSASSMSEEQQDRVIAVIRGVCD
ncbi:MAG: aminotransferase [Gammaproteobacteria bacterium]|nr:aminotransferase [Gammaproteobacteria bacterium]